MAAGEVCEVEGGANDDRERAEPEAPGGRRVRGEDEHEATGDQEESVGHPEADGQPVSGLMDRPHGDVPVAPEPVGEPARQAEDPGFLGGGRSDPEFQVVVGATTGPQLV